MQNESRAVFPNGIRTLIVESEARFLRSASLMFSDLNYRVATCDSPALAVRLLNGRLRHADVVFIDALRAATCGFDFRGIVEPHLCIPVIYFLSRDYGVTGDILEALQRTVSAATYVIMKPLAAADIYGLWGVIQQAKFMLRRGENTAWSSECSRGNRALLPASVQALLPSSSNVGGDQGEEDDGHGHFRTVRAARGRPRRSLGDRHDCGSSGRGRGRGCGRIAAVGRQPTRRLEQMNVTQGQESDADADDMIPSYQQPARQNLRGVQAMGVPNQQHGRSLFMQPVVPQMINMPCNNTMISMDAAGPSSSNVAAFDGASNTSASALLPLPVYHQALARATSPAPHALYSAQEPAPGLSPPVYQQQPPPMAAARAGRGQRRKLLDDGHDGGSSRRGCSRGRVAAYPSTVGGQPTGRQEQMNMAQEQESDDDDVVPFPWHQQQQLVPWMLNLPSNPSMISADAAGPSSSNAAAFAGARSVSSPALLPTYSAQVPAPGLPPVHRRQQQPVTLCDFSDMVAPPMATTSGHQPPQFALNQQHQQHDIFAPRRQGGWMERRRETEPIMLSFKQPPANFEASPASATDAAMAHIQSSPSIGAQPEPAESFDDVLRRTMMAVDDKFPRSNYTNCSAEALRDMAPPATDELAAMVSGNHSNYNSGSFMVADADGGNNASFMAPQDLAVPIGRQVELGTLSIYGSVESLGPSAMFDGNSDMAAMDQYDENTMFSMDALWHFGDDIPMLHPEGQGQQQDAAADSTAVANATRIISDYDDGLDIMEELLRKDKADDFQLPQDMNNGEQ